MIQPTLPPDGQPVRKQIGCQGFTLLEILVAMAILSVVVLAVYRLHAQSIAAVHTARFQAVAPLLARQKLAQVEIDGLEGLRQGSGDFGDGYRGYAWQLAVEDVAPDVLGEVAERLKRIELTISFDADAFVYRVQTYRFFQEGG